MRTDRAPPRNLSAQVSAYGGPPHCAIAALRATHQRIRALISGWSPEDFERAPRTGSWNARQILAHLAHIEMAFGTRARRALTTPDYTLQPFDQDRWMEQDSAVSGREAAEAFLALSRFNIALFASLSAEHLATPLSHPERGPITVEWILHTLAGHQFSHLRQLERIAGTGK